MFRVLREIKQLRRENEAMAKLIQNYVKPLPFDVGLTAIEWDILTEPERIMKIRKLDLILTMKKKGRWDYENNCATFAPKL